MAGFFRRHGAKRDRAARDVHVPTSPDSPPASSLRLDVPDPPAGMPYDQIEDHLNVEILRVNGIGTSEAELLRTLAGQSTVLQAAAAHVLGVAGSPPAREGLRDHLDDPDDLVRVEASYALARHGDLEGTDALRNCLRLPVDAYVCPIIAAGYLAQLGDSQGYPVVVQALQSEIDAIRMIACKQLAFFLPFDGQQDDVGGTVDAWQLFELALADSSADVQWQTLSQLGAEPSSRGRALLEDYAARATDARLKQYAERLRRAP